MDAQQLKDDAAAGKLFHTRVMWRFENGRSVLVAYEVFRHCTGQTGMRGIPRLRVRNVCWGQTLLVLSQIPS
jgi:hypothetical protein